MRRKKTAPEKGKVLQMYGYGVLRDEGMFKSADLLIGPGAGEMLRAGLAIGQERAQAKENAKRRTGGRRSAQARTDHERDRRIHDAEAAGKPRKQIAAAEGISVSQVGKILKTPRP